MRKKEDNCPSGRRASQSRTARLRVQQLSLAVSSILTFLLIPSLAANRQEQSQNPPKIIRKSGGVLQGSAITRVEPTYPPLAKAAKVAGPVVVEITIDEEGKVIAAHALSGHPLLRDAAVTAAKGWIFKPTVLSGTPVKVIGTITFNFELDFDAEINNASEEVKQHPRSASAHNTLAMALSEAGRDTEARSEFEEAIKLDPDSFDAHMGLALLLTRLHEDDAAVALLKEAANIGTLTAEMRVRLARQLLELKQNDLALSLLDQALKDNPESEETLTSMIMVCLEAGREDQAFELAKKGVALRPSSSRAHYICGAVAFKVKKIDLAITELKSAVEIKPDYLDAHYGLALAFLAKGDKESALKECAVVEKLDPDAAANLKAEIAH